MFYRFLADSIPLSSASVLKLVTDHHVTTGIGKLSTTSLLIVGMAAPVDDAESHDMKPNPTAPDI
jgi:hypothetical protein